MARYEISAPIYMGIWFGGAIEGDYGWDPSYGNVFHYETDDKEEAIRVFDAVTTTKVCRVGEGKEGKTIGLYLHGKYPWAEGIYADFCIVDTETEDYFDEVYEQLYLTEPKKED